MRLLLLGDIGPPHLKRWRDYFKDRGHAVQTVSLQVDATDRDYVLIESRVPIEAFKYYLERARVRRIIREFRPDLINGHFATSYGVLAVATGFKPVAVSLWGSDILVSPAKSRLHRARVRWVLGNADIITSDSMFMTETARNLGDFDAEFVTQPMGIPSAQLKRIGRSSVGKSDAPLNILSTRRLEPLYDVQLLLHALDRLKSKLPPYRCVICGDGSERDRLESLVAQLRLDNVEFVGFKDGREYEELLQSADIYVSCSKSDSTSVSLLDAMSAGALPVVTDIPGNLEWIEDSATALTFPPGDIDSLASCLLRAADDSDLRNRASSANRATVETRAVWEDNMAVIERAFESIVRTTAK